ncbi:MAG TPA: hypothetical protein VKU42_12740 [Candidatus Angelobacter sp.]|nr:hypothetical protein [Candidatus Angelobacter sp.]
MTDPERLLNLLEEAKKQLDESPNLLKNPEPPPGLSTKQWLEDEENEADS